MSGVSIPDFIEYEDVEFAVLPQGIHEASISTVEFVLVDKFAASTTRRVIFDQWRDFTAILRSLVAIEAVYIDGSFVTTKVNPKDVDASYWIRADDLMALSAREQSALRATMANSKAFNVDAFIVPECEAHHPARQEFDRMLWTEHYWTRCRDLNGLLLPPHQRRKGYLRITDG